MIREWMMFIQISRSTLLTMKETTDLWTIATPWKTGNGYGTHKDKEHEGKSELWAEFCYERLVIVVALAVKREWKPLG